MCVMVDANVGSEVFGRTQSDAGRHFLREIGKPYTRFVVGGGLLEELRKIGRFEPWYRQAVLYGRARRRISDEKIRAASKKVPKKPIRRSDDPHVLALAIASGARLLFTNDRRLQRDFRDPIIVNDPRGHIYSTYKNKRVTEVHRNLLNGKESCAWSGCGK